jgi:peptidoglycan/LPS O-acetylase OafA/YrhL
MGTVAARRMRGSPTAVVGIAFRQGPIRRRGQFRADIQGLRAIAVALVVLDHSGVPYLAGGFVGVDVFFVVSGFLITQWLLARTIDFGHVPFARFYATRARRILPAAALTLVSTCVASWYALNYIRALSAVHDVVWATFFAANVRFADISTNYFSRDDPPSPVQHFWTLAVEEQFYVLWPALLALALVIVGWRHRGFDVTVRRRLVVVVAVGVLLSLAWSVVETESHPEAAYFSTLARAWELGVGVLLALALPAIVRISTRFRAAMTWAGLVGILAAAVTYDSTTPFPGAAALLPVLAAALVIAGGVEPAPIRGAAVVLRRQPFQVVGDVSYSFYLWHWPVLVLAGAYLGRDVSTAEKLALMLAAFCLSYTTYRIYENPLRHARKLGTPRTALCLWPSSVGAVLAVSALVSSSIAMAPAAVASLVVGDRPGDEAAASGVRANPSATSAEVRAAVAVSVTPAMLRSPIPERLAPAIDKLLSDELEMKDCLPGSGTTSRLCHWGRAHSRRKVVVIGDSHGQMWMPAFVRFATAHRWRLIPLVKIGCVPSILGSGKCGTWYAWALDQIRRIHPRAIVVAQFWSAWGSSGVHAIGAELRALRPLARRVIVIQDAPFHPEPAIDCLLARNATRGSCTYGITQKESRTFAGVRKTALAVGARYVRTKQWLCFHGKCPTVVGNVITYHDRHHLTLTYLRFLARPVAHRIALAVS